MTTEKLNPIKGVGPYIDTRSRDQNKYKELFELFNDIFQNKSLPGYEIENIDCHFLSNRVKSL